jgi:hypothetical protein
MKRASPRIAQKGIKKYASNWVTSARKRKLVEKLANEGKIWNAVKSMYNIKQGNVSSREAVSMFFHPRYRKYNASKNIFVNKNNAERAIRRAISQKYIADILIPLAGNTRGGVDPRYLVNYGLKGANIKYAIINKNNKSLKALGLVQNFPNHRYINVIAGLKSYGHPMMNRILTNAGQKRVNLKAVTGALKNSNANNDPLVKWYMGKGFKRAGPLNLKSQLLPMSRIK